MSIEDGLSDQAKEYLKLQCNKNMERLKRCIDAKRWVVEREAIEHDCFMKECGKEGLQSKNLPTTDVGLEAGTKNLEGADGVAP